MLAAGYSTKMTEEDEQDVSAFENFAQRNLFAIGGGQGKVWRGGIELEFQVSSSVCQVRLRFAQTSL